MDGKMTNKTLFVIVAKKIFGKNSIRLIIIIIRDDDDDDDDDIKNSRFIYT